MKRRIVLAAVITLHAAQGAFAAQCDAPKAAITQGMDYAAARQQIIAAGWQAPSLGAYGYKEDDDKVRSDCFNSVEICNAFPEIEACSGQGNCAMTFADAYGNTLRVITYGALDRGAMVDHFEISCK